MSSQVKLKGRLSGYFNMPIRLGILLILADVLIYFMYWPAGVVVSLFLIHRSLLLLQQ